MKKIGGVGTLFFVLLAIFIVANVFAQNCTDNIQNQNETGIDCGGECDACITTPTTTQDLSKIEEAFECLEEEVGDCEDLTIQEKALVILASPDDVTARCVSELKDAKNTASCWGDNGCNVKDTALAVLALDHAGENTATSEEWLIKQNKTATDVLWYLEQDSSEATQCKISYSGNDYIVNIAENKKIDSSAGPCLNLAISNFWLRVSSDCYDTEFQISCDKSFISTLIYGQHSSSEGATVFYPLSDTASASASGTIELKIKSKCFGDNTCNYEGSAWATLALLQTGHNIENYLPYLIAAADSNERYLPNAFIYAITEDTGYGNLLVQEQKFNNWEADATAYNSVYDTSLALLALSSSSNEQVTKAKDWLLFKQGASGCWENTDSEIRDTSIALWALEGRGYSSPTSPSVTYCSDANYFCIPTSKCPVNEVLDNYFCGGTAGDVCCQNEHLELCSAMLGEVCGSDETCNGVEENSLDGACCLGTCEIQTPSADCDAMGYMCEVGECPSGKEEIDYDCDSGEVCCRTTTTPEGGSLWWLWVLIILILIVLGLLGYLKRANLKVWWFKIKSKFKKDKGTGSTNTGPGPRRGMPPSPGFHPVRRQPMFRPSQGRTPQRAPTPDKRMDNVFKKLQEMSK